MFKFVHCLISCNGNFKCKTQKKAIKLKVCFRQKKIQKKMFSLVVIDALLVFIYNHIYSLFNMQILICKVIFQNQSIMKPKTILVPNFSAI